MQDLTEAPDAKDGTDLSRMMNLTEDDYDALYAAVQADMPRITRGIFPNILAQLVGTGVIVMIVTDADITLSSPAAPETGVYRVERKRLLH